MPTRTGSLGQIQSAIWRELEQACSQRDHDWRVLSLATVDGQRAAARSVLLREIRASENQLLFYTDARSHKVAQLRQWPLGTLLAWSPSLSWQVRLEVELQVADSGLEVSSRWAQVKLSAAAQDYLAARPPGTPVEHFEPERDSRGHFAVVTAVVSAIDWLELHADGHRRARFDAEGSRWLAP